MWLVPILVCIFGLVFAFLPAEPLDEQTELAPAKQPWVPAAVLAAAAMLVLSGLLVVTL
jgi:hypothetical protein